MNEIIGYCIIGIGVIFDVLGCIGLIRMPDVYNRLQAATKSITFGTCGILLGVFVFSGFTEIGIKALIGIAFMLLTAPVAAHAIARGSRIFGVKLARQTVCDVYADEKRSELRGTQEEL